MLTDDDLTRELGEAFKAATADLTYTGRTQPSRRVMVVLPATAAVAVVASLAQRAAGAPAPLFAEVGFRSVPANARRVSVTRPRFHAWVGKDPKTGDNALYVKVPTRDGGQLFALLSPTWSQQRLIKVFENPQPRPVPAVSAGSNG
jgi:hypothetical protein